MDVIRLNREAWDRIGEDVASPYLQNPEYVRAFARFCELLPENAVVLDLGCGPGLPFTRALVDRGFRVLGVDFSETMIGAARRNVPEADYLRTSMTDIDFPPIFDGIFSGYSMLCLDPDGFAVAARRAAGALKAGGLFFLALNEPAAGETGGSGLVEILGARMYSRAYTEEEVRQVFLGLGMRILSVARETVECEAYGEEHSLLILMSKS
jgi:SAM-dependent methyltransferase